MNKDLIIKNTRKFAEKTISKEATGHDFFHVKRVTKLAKYIAINENNADLFIIEIAALLHDIADWKFNNADENVGPTKARKFLENQKVSIEIIDEVEYIIKHISFKGGTNKVKMRTIEGKIVQDADRLDALGAIGIARTFAYGGFKGREIYNPKIKPKTYKNLQEYANTENTTLNHFYEKLLLLSKSMNTEIAKQIARDREKFMKLFLKNFLEEWEVKI